VKEEERWLVSVW